ncbi:outer membrane lipoprotein-sorting protein [Bacteroidota bacterium]
MRLITLLFILSCTTLFSQNPTATDILNKVDKNMASESRIFTSKMIINGKRGTRTIESKSWSKGENNAFTEYLSPARETGTKMLKLEDKLWIYSPATDRIIQISGHMLRQSVMGSDLSYEDMMSDAKLTDKYNAKVLKTEVFDNRSCWVLELIAKVEDVAYYKRMIWIDKERFIPLKEELFAKSGKLLKQTTLSDVVKIEGRWFPRKIVYKDMLKEGDGTEFIITDIQFNALIPDYILSKASLKK